MKQRWKRGGDEISLERKNALFLLALGAAIHRAHKAQFAFESRRFAARLLSVGNLVARALHRYVFIAWRSVRAVFNFII